MLLAHSVKEDGGVYRAPRENLLITFLLKLCVNRKQAAKDQPPSLALSTGTKLVEPTIASSSVHLSMMMMMMIMNNQSKSQFLFLRFLCFRVELGVVLWYTN